MFTKIDSKKPASQPVIKLVSLAQRVFPSLNLITTTDRIIIQFRNSLNDFLCSLLYIITMHWKEERTSIFFASSEEIQFRQSCKQFGVALPSKQL